MALDPQLVFLVLVPVAGWLMVQAGIGKNMLEWRRRPRSCPSCGRLAQDCGCG